MSRTQNSKLPEKSNAPVVGSRVTLDWGGSPVEAEVLEDRGPLGVGGRRILRVRVNWDPQDASEPSDFEIPAENVTVVR